MAAARAGTRLAGWLLSGPLPEDPHRRQAPGSAAPGARREPIPEGVQSAARSAAYDDKEPSP